MVSRYVQEASESTRTVEDVLADREICDGSGYEIVERTRPTCCGNTYPSGECRSHCAVPEYYQDQEPCPGCAACLGTGKAREKE